MTKDTPKTLQVKRKAVFKMPAKAKDFNGARGIDISKPHAITDEFRQMVFYPAHEPRKESGIYRKTHTLMIKTNDMPCRTCGVRNSDYVRDGKGTVTKYNPMGAIQNETHHDIIEWAAANGIDWDKVAKDYPDLKSLEHIAHAWDLQQGRGHHQAGDPTQDETPPPEEHRKKSFKHVHYTEIDATEFLDGVEQMRVLCVAPSSEILMDDGTHKKISDIEIGDQVIGGDGKSHSVTAKISRYTSKKMVQINDSLVCTTDHPILTQRGWVEAGKLLPGSDEVYEVPYQSVSPLLANKVLVGVVNNHESRLHHHNVPLFVSNDSFAMPNYPIYLDDEFIFRNISIDSALSNFGLLSIGNPKPVKSIVQVFLDTRDLTSFRSALSILRISPHTFATAVIPSLISFHIGRMINRVTTSTAWNRAFLSRNRIKTSYTTFIGTINSWPSFKSLKTKITGWTRNFNSRRTKDSLPSKTITFLGASSNIVRSSALQFKQFLTRNTFTLYKQFGIKSLWNTMMDFHTDYYSRKTNATPLVYDIEIEGAHSFIANGITIHNCDVHHRHAYYGIHSITGPIWKLQEYQRDGFNFVPMNADKKDVKQ